MCLFLVKHIYGSVDILIILTVSRANLIAVRSVHIKSSSLLSRPQLKDAHSPMHLLLSSLCCEGLSTRKDGCKVGNPQGYWSMVYLPTVLDNDKESDFWLFGRGVSAERMLTASTSWPLTLTCQTWWCGEKKGNMTRAFLRGNWTRAGNVCVTSVGLTDMESSAPYIINNYESCTPFKIQLRSHFSIMVAKTSLRTNIFQGVLICW